MLTVGGTLDGNVHFDAGDELNIELSGADQFAANGTTVAGGTACNIFEGTGTNGSVTLYVQATIAVNDLTGQGRTPAGSIGRVCNVKLRIPAGAPPGGRGSGSIAHRKCSIGSSCSGCA
jgi:hypothetical protein